MLCHTGQVQRSVLLISLLPEGKLALWIHAKGIQSGLMLNLSTALTASLMCLQGIPQYGLFEKHAALKKMSQVS